MSIFQDFININKEVLPKTIKSFTKNWMMIFAGLAYLVINIVAFTIINILFVGPLRIIAGFVNAFIIAATLSNYLYLLYNVIYFDHISIEKFKYGFKAFLRPVYSVLIIGWIASYFLNVFGIISPVGAMSISSLASLIIFIVLNALPETLYQKNYNGMETIIYSMEFFKDNIINWAVPNAIFYIILFLVTGNISTDVLPTSFAAVSFLNPFMLVSGVLGQIIFTFMMMYRGHLYKILSTSTKRKREFMSKM